MGLLGMFAMVSAVLVIVLGVLLTVVLRSIIEERALRRAEQLARSVGQLAVEPHLTPQDFVVEHIDDAREAQLEAAIRRGLSGQVVTRVKIFSAQGTVVYSDERELIGSRFDPSIQKSTAFAGGVASKLDVPAEDDEHRFERGLGSQLEVFVPVKMQVDGEEQVLGALELYLPFEPIAREIAADERVLRGVLAFGLVLLWLGQYQLVARASRRLNKQIEENRRLALHDPLTGLPNRTLFTDRTERAVASARRSGASVAILLINLDRFKEVNDTLGHHMGDVLICEIADRLEAELRDADTIARLGGDEFAVLMPEVRDPEAPIHCAMRILDAVRRPFDVDGVTIEVDASIGAASFPEHGADGPRLLQCADVAMYAAKDEHTGLVQYVASLDEHTPQRLALFGELRRAIDNDELVLHYQPIADVVAGRIKGVEALVRWQHRERGLLPPDQFIDVAEQTGLIRPMTRYVLNQALQDCRTWRDRGLQLSVAVNLSPRNLLDTTLPTQVHELLQRHGLPQEALEFEITESTVMVDPVRALQILDELHRSGIQLSVDDYGTGHASLAYLSNLPVDALKIDRSFVMDMATGTKGEVIVRSTIDLARNLGLLVVAEGVESGDVYRRLSELGCDAAQGFWLARPGPADSIPDAILTIEHRLQDRTADASMQQTPTG
jgi:diguanylate cyclase (GGDEF)-like protein